MSQQNKMEDGDRGTGRYPLRRWWQPNRLFGPDFGLPPLLEAGGWSDMDRSQRGLAALFWPGFAPAPMFVPHISESPAPPSQRISRLPATVDATKMVSTLSVDGILTVEAPVPETSGPAAVLIPVKVTFKRMLIDKLIWFLSSIGKKINANPPITQ
ncbi:unnamed protein product [Menidia menidia]|uniref:(Atlantic silverside) hypothetical protein n=1 Tax=Menidia menidia TaxID=238744 RepID=A0A8S4B6P2_9TELE|nr:unnamed protein product [Menidia menidia]